MAPRVSVVVPVFNRKVAVRRAVESVLAQSCQDFEVIVVDDGSNDGTSETLAALTHPRISVIRHETRRGGSAARNTGIAAGVGEFVAFLDSDDEWLPTKLERQLEAFARSDRNVALAYTGTERYYSDGSCIVHIPGVVADPALALLTENVIGETSVGMLRRSALDVVGGFDESLPASQEMDLWLRVCERFRAVLVPEALVRVDKRDDSNRITASIPSTTRGRELFRRKHRARMVQCGVLHLHLCESGWWYLRGAREAAAARRCAFEAIAARPAAPQPYGLLLAATVPFTWLDRLAKMKHQAAGTLGRAWRARSGGRHDLLTSPSTRERHQ